MGVWKASQRAIIGNSEQKENTVSKSYYIPEVTQKDESSELPWKLSFWLDFGREAISIQHQSYCANDHLCADSCRKMYFFNTLSRRKESFCKRVSKPKCSLNPTLSELDRIQLSFLKYVRKKGLWHFLLLKLCSW